MPETISRQKKAELSSSAGASFMNTLFHGLDFRKLQSGPALFNFGSFVYMRAVPGFFPELSTQLAKGDSP